MRKLPWRGTAVAVAVGVSVGLAAAQARNQPGATLALWSSYACRLVGICNPLAVADETACANVCYSDHIEPSRAALAPEMVAFLRSIPSAVRIDDPGICGGDKPECPKDCCDADSCRGAEKCCSADACRGAAECCDDEPGRKESCDAKPVARALETCKYRAVDECEEPVPFMPMCRDNLEKAPHMPYAGDTEWSRDMGGEAFFDVFIGEWDAAPRDGWETPEGTQPVDYREDPDHHRQYPGCPHMGNCPSGRGAGGAAGDVVPKPSHSMLQPRPVSYRVGPREKEGTPRMPPGKAEVHGTWLPVENRWGSGADQPAHPDVDTLEFRSSDARKGEFDRRPW